MGTSSLSLPAIQFARRLMKNPIGIHWQNPDLTLEGVRQFYINVQNVVQSILLQFSLDSRKNSNIFLF